MSKDQPTFNNNPMDRKDRWNYYISSFVRVEPTEGVSRGRLSKVLLTRNLPSNIDTDSEDGAPTQSQRPLRSYNENLIIRICVNSFKMTFQRNTSEFFVYNDTNGEALERKKEARNEKFEEKFERNNKWMKGLSQGQVQKVKEDFQKWVVDGVVPGSESEA